MHQSHTKAFWPSLLLLALPVAAQTLLQAMLGMTDVVMVGSLGSTAIASVGLATKIHFLLLVTMIGLASGCSVLVAQYSGARDSQGTRRTLAVTLLVGSVAVLPFILLFTINPIWWVSKVTPDAEVAALTARYLQITALSLWLTQIIVIYEASLRAMGNTTLPLAVGACAVLLNVIFNYLLIFGHFGFPALGVEGAAWSTIIARSLQLLLIVGWVYLRRHHFAMGRRELITYATDRHQLRRYLAFAAPLVINHVIWALGNTAYHVVSGFSGTDALAVMGAIVPIESAFFAIFVGLANASTIMIGRSLGADEHDKAWWLYKIFDRIAIVLVILMSLGLWLAMPWALALFSQVEGNTALLLSDTLLIFCLLVWVKVLNMLRIVGILRAGGDNRFCLINDTIVMWVFGVPVFAMGVFVFNLPFQWLYVLMFLEDILKFLPVRIRLGQRKWLKNLTGSAH